MKLHNGIGTKVEISKSLYKIKARLPGLVKPSLLEFRFEDSDGKHYVETIRLVSGSRK